MHEKAQEAGTSTADIDTKDGVDCNHCSHPNHLGNEGKHHKGLPPSELLPTNSPREGAAVDQKPPELIKMTRNPWEKDAVLTEPPLIWQPHISLVFSSPELQRAHMRNGLVVRDIQRPLC